MRRLFPTLAVIFLGLVLVCGCGEQSAILGPGSGRDDGSDSSAEGEDPGEPDDQGDADDQGESDEPGEPDDPGDPDDQGEPDEPGESDEPDEPGDPEEPDGPRQLHLSMPLLDLPADPAPAPEEAEQSGRHLGERCPLEVEIDFSGEFGETVTDDTGTHYYYGGGEMHEDKVYPSEYWGTFPLYFFGTEVGVTVTARNNGPRRRTKLVIRTEAYVLLTDGSNGAGLAEPRDIVLEIERGETITVDFSFTAEYRPDVEGLEGGLDRFVVKVLHVNQGRGKDGEAGLIMEKEAVFCPPEPDEL